MELTVFIGREVSRALAHLHERVDAGGVALNLSHQDVCPQNIFITDKGGVLLIPFGLARSYRMVGEATCGWLGRRHDYKAPEQLRGAVNDPRSDVYALGVVIRDLLLGQGRAGYTFHPRPGSGTN